MPTQKAEPKIETKSVKHVFTNEELNTIGADLARSIGTLRGIETEFDQVKASFKARTAEADARIDSLSDLFPRTESDSGLLIVGKFAGKWFAALRVRIGKLSLDERLDSEQRSFKARPDAVKHSTERAWKWLKTNLKEHAKGFEDSLAAVVEAHKERAE